MTQPDIVYAISSEDTPLCIQLSADGQPTLIPQCTSNVCPSTLTVCDASGTDLMNDVAIEQFDYVVDNDGHICHVKTTSAVYQLSDCLQPVDTPLVVYVPSHLQNHVDDLRCDLKRLPQYCFSSASESYVTMNSQRNTFIPMARKLKSTDSKNSVNDLLRSIVSETHAHTDDTRTRVKSAATGQPRPVTDEVCPVSSARTTGEVTYSSHLCSNEASSVISDILPSAGSVQMTGVVESLVPKLQTDDTNDCYINSQTPVCMNTVSSAVSTADSFQPVADVCSFLGDSTLTRTGLPVVNRDTIIGSQASGVTHVVSSPGSGTVDTDCSDVDHIVLMSEDNCDHRLYKRDDLTPASSAACSCSVDGDDDIGHSAYDCCSSSATVDFVEQSGASSSNIESESCRTNDVASASDNYLMTAEFGKNLLNTNSCTNAHDRSDLNVSHLRRFTSDSPHELRQRIYFLHKSIRRLRKHKTARLQQSCYGKIRSIAASMTSLCNVNSQRLRLEGIERELILREGHLLTKKKELNTRLRCVESREDSWLQRSCSLLTAERTYNNREGTPATMAECSGSAALSNDVNSTVPTAPSQQVDVDNSQLETNPSRDQRRRPISTLHLPRANRCTRSTARRCSELST